MSDKLLPCPFCGGEPLVKGIVEDCSGGGSNYIECADCHISTPLFYSCGEDAIPPAIECWNHRAALKGA